MVSIFKSLLIKSIPKLRGLAKQNLVRADIAVIKMLTGRVVYTHAHLLNTKLTEPHVHRWITEHLNRGEVCFDVGAHQGWMSMVAARKTGRAGRVVAFEPSPPSLEFLSFHKRKNKLSQLEIVPKAVSDKDDAGIDFSLVREGNSFMNSLSIAHIPEISPQLKSSIKIDTVSLDTFSRQTGLVPHLIKIDVEGAELLVCRGAHRLISHYRPKLIIATHPLWLPDGQQIEELFQLLSDCGYRIIDSRVCKYSGSDFGDYLFIAD